MKKYLLMTLLLTEILFLWIFILECKVVVAQDSEVAKEIPKPYYKFEVKVTNVDVFVNDKYGYPIAGLKPENFEIYDNGVLQKITNFYEVKGKDIYLAIEKAEGKLVLSEAPIEISEADESTRTKVVFYFDNLQMHPLNKSWVIKRLEKFIKNNFSKGYFEGMVVSLDQQLRIVQEFTKDQDRLLQVINDVAQESSDMMLKIKAREDLKENINKIIEEKDNFDKFENLERALGLAQNYVDYVENDIMTSLKNLDSLVNFLGGVEGRKIIIYMSDGLPLNPAEEVYTYIDQAFPQGDALSKALNYDLTRLFREITSRCNAYNISIYTINAMGLESSMVTADKKTEWNIYSKGFGMLRNQSRFQNAGLQLMAEDTGGIAIVNANNIDAGLEKIANSLSNYYSIGFKSKSKDNKIRNLEVKVKGLNQDYTLRYRRSYKLFSSEERIEDTVMSRLFLRFNDNKLNVSSQVNVSGKELMRKKEIPVSIKLLIPLKNIMLIKGDNEYNGKIEVYFSVKDSIGNISPCYRLEHEIKIPVEDYDIALKSNYPYLVDTKLIPGEYVFSIAVRDVNADVVSYIQFDKEIR